MALQSWMAGVGLMIKNSDSFYPAYNQAHSFWVKKSHGYFHSTEQDAGLVPATVPPLLFPVVKMIWGHPRA